MNESAKGNFGNPCTGIPLVESPFFDEAFPAHRTDDTARIARALHRDGVVRIRFRSADFDPAADEVIRDLRERFDLDRWKIEGGDLRLQDAWRTSEAVRKIATSKIVLRLLEQLYGRRAFPFQTLNFPVGAALPVHSDTMRFSSVPERFVCSVWVALEDVTVDNGPLVYYPGTHRWPIYTNEHLGISGDLSDCMATQERYHGFWRELVKAKSVAPQRFLARKGEALIWAANLLHGGELQKDRSRTRWSQLTHYFFEDCAYYAPMTSVPMLGLIDFRDPVDITTGEVVRSSYGGEPIPGAFVQACRQHAAQDARCFDAALYLLANPDVAEAKMDPLRHYLLHGRYEGRKLRP